MIYIYTYVERWERERERERERLGQVRFFWLNALRDSDVQLPLSQSWTKDDEHGGARPPSHIQFLCMKASSCFQESHNFETSPGWLNRSWNFFTLGSRTLPFRRKFGVQVARQWLSSSWADPPAEYVSNPCRSQSAQLGALVGWYTTPKSTLSGINWCKFWAWDSLLHNDEIDKKDFSCLAFAWTKWLIFVDRCGLNSP